MLVTKSNPVRGRVGKRHQGKASKRRGHRVRRQRQKKVKGEEEEEESERNQEARGKTTERQRQEDGSVEKEEKRKEQRVRAVLDQGGVPTKVAVGRDRNEAGVLLLLAPCLVGPVVQVCQVGRALCTELHPGRACKDSPVSTQGRREAHPSDQTPLGGHTGKPRPSSSAPPPPSPEPKLLGSSRPGITLTEWQLSQWQRAETGMAVMRCGLLCWSMQALAPPCMWELMPTCR